MGIRIPEVAKKTTDAIHGVKPSTNISVISYFLGFFNVFRRLFHHFLRIAVPPDAKLKKSEPSSLELDETDLTVMQHLKEIVEDTAVSSSPETRTEIYHLY